MASVIRPGALRPVRRWTVQDYHHMGATGLLGEDDRVELLDGEVIEMAPIGSQHASRVRLLGEVLRRQLGDSVLVDSQNPLHLDDYSEPQPDLTLLRPRKDYYGDSHPRAGDVLLLIEVADTSVRFDREVKVPLYARHGIPEIWLVDIPGRRLEAYRDPGPEGYRRSQVHQASRVSPAAFPGVVVDLAALFSG